MENNFGKLGIHKEVLRVIEEEGFETPTKVQNRAIPQALANEDLIVTSATGSGKTLVYIASLVKKVIPGNGVQGLVILPTRELTKQVGEVLKKFSKNTGLNIMISFGGGSIKQQKEDIVNADIIVGTCGRISDYVERELFQLGKLKVVVLDEVDLIVQDQFREELEFILKTTPKNKQTLVFSATISKDINKIVREYLNSPKRINGELQVNPKTLKQVFYEIENDKKLSLLNYLISNEKSGLSIVFTNRQDTAEFLSKNLNSKSIKIKTIHGDLNQGARNRILKEFSEEKFDVLITTDIAARGIDIEGISHIYNYNLPKFDDKYIHRIGRCARAGKSGKVINLIAKTDIDAFANILKNNKISIARKSLPEFETIEAKKKYVKKKSRR